MDEVTRYYRYPVGNVILRRTGNTIEKFGKNRVWEDASDQLRRFCRDDDSLTEISKEEAYTIAGLNSLDGSDGNVR